MGSKSIIRISAAAVAAAAAISMAPVAAFAGDQPDIPSAGDSSRIAGANRYTVSVNAAKQAIADGQATGDTFILASGLVFPDAITATPLSGCMDAPVLLTNKTSLSTAVIDLLKAEKPTRIIVSGGPMSVPNSIIAQIKAYLPDVAIERNGGVDRYEAAYNNAAEADACYLGGNYLTNIQNASEELQALSTVDSDLAAAQAAYDAAFANYEKAVAARNAAQTKINDLAAQIDTLMATLVQVPPADAEALNKAKEDQYAAATALATAQAHAAVINSLPAVPVGATETAPTADSTIQEYLNLAAMTSAKAAQVQAALTYFGGMAPTNTFKEVTAAANTRIDALQADYATANQAYIKAVQAAYNAAQADAANAATLAKVAQLKNQMDALQANLDDVLVPAVADAGTKLGQARAALEEARAAKIASVGSTAATDLARARREAIMAAGRNGTYETFLTTGTIYTDALTTGPAAAHSTGVVILSKGTTMGTWSSKYEAEFAQGAGGVVSQKYAVGGAAIQAVAGKDIWKTVPGADRYAVSAAVAKRFFVDADGDLYPSVASGEIFTDATVGGSFSALYDNPLLLARKSTLPASVDTYIREENQVQEAVVIGGPVTLDKNLVADLDAALARK